MGIDEDLQPGERLDDLLTHDLKIIQQESQFSFSLDAVLLARFCAVPSRGTIIDLGCGNGVIPLLLSTRTKANMIGVEIQPPVAMLAKRNVQFNRLERQISIECADLREYHLIAGYGAFDLVTVNPPYLPIETGQYPMNPQIAAAKYELKCNLMEVILACSRLVKSGGKVAIVHRPSRLAEILNALQQVSIEPKRIRFVHPYLDQEANMVLIEGMKDGKPSLRLLPPCVVHQTNGQYTHELAELLNGTKNSLSYM
jgi:tRNA1(Val) A37 N6-methylase TrmN6